MKTIPVCDPSAGLLGQQAGIEAALRRVLASNRYILGPEVEAFEAEFASYCGTRQAVGVANGTDALVLALRALGIGRGDTVMTVSLTATATVAAIRIVGATPLLVDVQADSGLINPERVAEALAARSAGSATLRAIVPVHLYGRLCAMDDLSVLAAGCGADLVEDCAQANGAQQTGKRAGSFGRLSAFSFYPTKNLGAIGDGGAVLTSDAELAARLRRLRQYGWSEPQWSVEEGINSRLDELQAAILRLRLPKLDAENRLRQQRAALYDALLGDLPREQFRVPPAGEPGLDVYHQYACQTPQRDALRQHLAAAGIGTGIHYPHPVHRQPGYTDTVLVAPGGLPETERIARETISLPMYPELPVADAERVAEAIRAFFRR